MTPKLVARIAKGGFVVGSIKLAGLVVSFLFLLTIARYLDPVRFGIFASAFSVSLMLGAICTFGQHTAVLRFWPAFDEVEDTTSAVYSVQRSLILCLLLCIVAVAFSLVLWQAEYTFISFGDDPRIWLVIAALGTALAVSNVLMSVFRAMHYTLVAFLPQNVFWRVLAMPVALFPITWAEPGTVLAVTSGVLWLLNFAQFAILVLKIPAVADFRLKRKVLAETRHTLRATQLGLWGNAVIGPLQQQGSTVVVGMALGPLEAGAFFAALRLANLLSIVEVAANQITGPMMSRSWRSGRLEEVKDIVSTAVVLSTAIAIVGMLVYVGLGGWMLVSFDPSYGFAYTALIILCGAQVVNTFCGPNALLLLMSGHQNSILMIRSAAALLGLGLTYALGMIGGVSLAAFGTALGVALLNVLGMIECSRVTGVSTSFNGVLRRFRDTK